MPVSGWSRREPSSPTTPTISRHDRSSCSPAAHWAIHRIGRWQPADAVAVEMTTGAMDLQVFPGRLIGRDLSLPERLITTKTHAPYGDFRPWDDILDWTREIARYLHEESVAAGDARRADGAG